MWANYYPEATICWPTKRKALIRSGPSRRHRAIPVAVIPLDDVPALQSTAYNAFWEAQDAKFDSMESVVAALSAIGVLPRKGGRK